MTPVDDLVDVTWEALSRLDSAAVARTARALRDEHLPPVSTALVRPTGFTAAIAGDLRLTTRAGRACLIDEGGQSVAAVGPQAVIDRAALAAVRPYRSVIVGTGSGHGPVILARLLAQLLVAGVPIRAAALPSSVRRLLGDGLSSCIDGLDGSTLDDPDQRAAWSVRTRRQALLQLTTAGGVGPPRPVAVLVDLTDDAHRDRLVTETLAQDWPAEIWWLTSDGSSAPEVEAGQGEAGEGKAGGVLVATGDDPVRAGLRELAGASAGPTTVLTPDLTYGPQHLRDLVLAHGFSGSALTGVDPRRTYLPRLDVTVESDVAEGERDGKPHPGATLGSSSDLLAAREATTTSGARPGATGPSGYVTHDLSVTRLAPDVPGAAEVPLAGAHRQWSGWLHASEGRIGRHPQGIGLAGHRSYFSR